MSEFEELWGDESPTLFLIKDSFRDEIEWKNTRVARLCKRLNCTLRELAALAGVFNKSDVSRHYQADSWPVSVQLHFARIEKFLDSQQFGSEGLLTQDALTAKVIKKHDRPPNT